MKSVCLVLVLMAVPAPAPPVLPPAVRAAVEARQRRATRLAAGKKLEPALQVLGDARNLLTAARRKAAAPPRNPTDPRLRRELTALTAWLDSQARLAREGKADLEKSYRTYQARRAELIRKYPRTEGAVRPGPASTAAAQAPFDLLLATLDDTSADYLGRLGRKQSAAQFRLRGMSMRLSANSALGRYPQARAVAEKILATNPTDSSAYNRVGQFYEEHREWQPAASAWQSGIRSLQKTGKTGGMTNSPHRGTLELFYRQLAFCYQKLGKNAEMDEALRKANSLARPPVP